MRERGAGSRGEARVEGRWWYGALVVAFNQRHPYMKQRVRADQNGRATFTVGEPGPWLVKAVHMVPAPAGSGADWDSVWAALTFEIGT